MIQHFDITLTRTATRRLKISVPAETLEEAQKKALNIAGDCTFTAGSEGEPEYGVEGLIDQPPASGFPTIENLLDAIKEVETGGHPDPKNAVGDGGKSQGAYQIGWAYSEDARQQIAKEHSPTPPQYSDIVHDDQWCREIIKAYWRRYAPGAYSGIFNGAPDEIEWCCEALARSHNGGPSGSSKAATIPYWNKVKAVLQKRGFTL